MCQNPPLKNTPGSWERIRRNVLRLNRSQGNEDCFFFFSGHAFSNTCCKKLCADQIFLVTKTPREDFFRKVLPQNVFLVFSCLAARPVKAHIALPMRKNSWRTTGPLWRHVILDIRTRHLLSLHAHLPRQTPSAQRKRFSTRCICTQTL